MASERKRKCAKCHVTSDDANVSFHRFPLPGKLGTTKARAWASYCYPDEDWSSEESLKALHVSHKMLCGQHFDDSAYSSSGRKRLKQSAIPTGPLDSSIQFHENQWLSSQNIPLTAAERKRRYREKLRKYRPEEYKAQCKRNLDRMNSLRKNISDLSPKEAARQRKKWREVKRRYNEKKKTKENELLSSVLEVVLIS